MRRPAGNRLHRECVVCLVGCVDGSASPRAAEATAALVRGAWLLLEMAAEHDIAHMVLFFQAYRIQELRDYGDCHQEF